MKASELKIKIEMEITDFIQKKANELKDETGLNIKDINFTALEMVGGDYIVARAEITLN